MFRQALMEKPAAQVDQGDTEIRHDLVELHVDPIDVVFALKAQPLLFVSP